MQQQWTPTEQALSLFHTMRLASEQCYHHASAPNIPNSIKSRLFSTTYTDSQLKKRFEFKLASLCFKSLNGSAPTYLSGLLHLYTPSRQLHSSADTRVFRVPSIRTVMWSALFLLPSSNNMEQTPRFYPSRILCQFLQSSLKTFLFLKTFSSVPLP